MRLRDAVQRGAGPNFNHLAWVYRWLEYASFGPWLQRCRTHFLTYLAESQPGVTRAGVSRALVLGDGDGRFTAQLVRQCRAIRVHAVDGSPAMLQALRRAAGSGEDRITTEVADLRFWQATAPKAGQPAGFDLVATHFFLDCLSTSEIAGLAGRLDAVLEENALWLISEFAIPDGLYGRLIARPIVSLLYLGFGLLTGLRVRTLPDHGRVLRAAGWTLEASHDHCKGLLLSQLWRRNCVNRKAAFLYIPSGIPSVLESAADKSATDKSATGDL